MDSTGNSGKVIIWLPSKGKISNQGSREMGRNFKQQSKDILFYFYDGSTRIQVGSANPTVTMITFLVQLEHASPQDQGAQDQQ